MASGSNLGMTLAADAPYAGTAARRDMPVRRLAVVAALLALPVLLVLTAGGPDWNALGTDSRMQIGFETHTRRAMAGGLLPLWNPYHLGGQPHLADPATLALYPPHVALRVLPLEAFFRVSFVFHAWIFGIGAYLVGRQAGGSRLAALLGSAGAMLGTVVRPGPDLVYSSTVYAAAWLPLIVAFAMRSVGRHTRRPHPGLVAATALALTGPPRGQVFALAAVACWYAFAARRSGPIPRRTLFVQAAALAILSGGLSGFASLPHLELRAAAALAGGLAREAVHLRPTYDSSGTTDRLLASAASAAPGSRVISQCRTVADGSRFLPLGIPTVDGYGGAFLADYGRFARIVSDTRGAPGAAPAALVTAVRADLLPLLDVGATVACPAASDSPSPGEDGDRPSIGYFRDRLPRAFWTCRPHRATREELDYLLTSFRYDEALTLREPNPIVHVRWAAHSDASVRGQAEAALKLRARRYVDGTTWQYDLLDSSRANLAAIVGHPAVEDTAGFERGALALPSPPELPRLAGAGSEWVIGMSECDDPRPATIERADTADGYLVAAVDAPRDGMVFLSETYSPLRAAWVDGVRADALKVDYAFTGIPVSAGLHRVELRADARSFGAGLATSALTLIGWVAFTWMPRRR